MKPLPDDPFALQRRAMVAMCDDLFDMGAGLSKRFARLDALRQVSIETRKQQDNNREAGTAQEAPAINQHD